MQKDLINRDHGPGSRYEVPNKAEETGNGATQACSARLFCEIGTKISFGGGSEYKTKKMLPSVDKVISQSLVTICWCGRNRVQLEQRLRRHPITRPAATINYRKTRSELDKL